MPELRDDTTEDGFHEIQLSGKQLVFLFMATTVVSIFIFLVGVRVGRDVAAKRGDEPIGSSAAAVPPGAATDAAELAPPDGEPPSPPAEDELSYHKRLQSAAVPEEVTPPVPDEQPEAKPAPAPAAQTPPPAGPDVPTAGRPGTWVLQVIALKNRAAAAELVQRLAGKGYPAFLESPAPGTPVIYRVRIGRYNDRREAEQVGRRLEKEEQLTSVITR